MVVRDYESELKGLFPEGEVTASQPKHFWVNVDRQKLREAVRAIRERLGIRHLTTIVAEDLREHFLVSYIFAGEVVVVLKVKADREKPEVPSLAPLITGALVYEREIHDLFGIVPIEHPDLVRQVLPEDWPEGLYPLRKDVTLPRPTIPGEGEPKDA